MQKATTNSYKKKFLGNVIYQMFDKGQKPTAAQERVLSHWWAYHQNKQKPQVVREAESVFVR